MKPRKELALVRDALNRALDRAHEELDRVHALCATEKKKSSDLELALIRATRATREGIEADARLAEYQAALDYMNERAGGRQPWGRTFFERVKWHVDHAAGGVEYEKIVNHQNELALELAQERQKLSASCDCERELSQARDALTLSAHENVRLRDALKARAGAASYLWPDPRGATSAPAKRATPKARPRRARQT